MALSSSPLPSAFDLVRPPRAARAVAIVVVVVLVGLPLLLAFVPWQQNVPAKGRVTALDPLDRTQIIPAPVTGRLEKLYVLEGSLVQEGDVLAEMRDQDPLFGERLVQKLSLSNQTVTTARRQVEFYDNQLLSLEEAREEAISAASFELEIALEKVEEAEYDLYGLEADRDQKFLDFQRKSRLLPEGLVSEYEYQVAEAEYNTAKAKVDAARTKVKQARSEEKAKSAKVSQISADERAKIDSTRSLRQKAEADLFKAEQEVQDAETSLARQGTQVITATRSGFVQRVHAASSADLLKQGDPLIEIVPETEGIVAELWVRGIDAPLIFPGRRVRLQFEGWPAVQFAGWPSVAVGTFGGVVQSVDAYASADGKVRVLVAPDPEDAPWPDPPFLRQGVRANGWLLLDTVSLGYEFWRQLNAFPPSIDRDKLDPAMRGASTHGAKNPAES